MKDLIKAVNPKVKKRKRESQDVEEVIEINEDDMVV
jgi:hypothetical protein